MVHRIFETNTFQYKVVPNDCHKNSVYQTVIVQLFFPKLFVPEISVPKISVPQNSSPQKPCFCAEMPHALNFCPQNAWAMCAQHAKQEKQSFTYIGYYRIWSWSDLKMIESPFCELIENFGNGTDLIRKFLQKIRSSERKFFCNFLYNFGNVYDHFHGQNNKQEKLFS